MSTELKFDELTVRYDADSSPVLKRLSLTLPAGEFLVVLGRSGCGKSTLLNAAAGLVPVESGAVRLAGAEVRRPGRDRGVVFQHDVLYPWMSVQRNVAFGLKAMGVSKRERLARARDLLATVGLDPDQVATRLPHELSGGMRQRVGIARMLATEPRVMLMDEPFGALDAMTRLAMQDLVIDLWQQFDATILFITHDVEEALRLSSAVAVLGTGGALLEHRANPLPQPRPANAIAELPGYVSLRRDLHDLISDPTAVAARRSDNASPPTVAVAGP